jgi:hypothetical protein
MMRVQQGLYPPGKCTIKLFYMTDSQFANAQQMQNALNTLDQITAAVKNMAILTDEQRAAILDPTEAVKASVRKQFVDL